MSKVKVKENLKGLASNYWTVIEFDANKTEQRKRTIWVCKCVCGTIGFISTYDLKSGKSKSCGCQSPNKLKDLTGKKFGKLTVLERTNEKKGAYYYWLCICECGNTHKAHGGGLRNGKIKSCGCLVKESAAPRLKNLIGKRFGNLTVIKRTDNQEKEKEKRVTYWVCLCDCGTITESTTTQLNLNRKISCGCSHYGFEDIKGKKIGRWTVLELDSLSYDAKQAFWVCKCDCGTIRTVTAHTLKSGKSRSCGCLKDELTRQRNEIDLIGKVFGRYTVVKESGYVGHTRFWLCQCECGNIREVSTGNLTSGNSQSCGCLKIELQKAKVGELSSGWKGGVSEINAYFRGIILDWKKDSFDFWNYKCAITGQRGDLQIHHLFPFHKISEEFFKKTKAPLREKLCDYSQQEIEYIREEFLKLHNSYGLGVCLSTELHIEFHKIYGQRDFTPEDFCEFHRNKTGKEFIYEINMKEVEMSA